MRQRLCRGDFVGAAVLYLIFGNGAHAASASIPSPQTKVESESEALVEAATARE